MNQPLAWIAGILLLTAGCASDKPMVTRYYTLELPDSGIAPRKDGTPLITGSCEITRVEIAPLYDNNQIVNRSGSNQVTYYRYNLWAIRPSVAVHELLKEYLDQSALFSEVSGRYSNKVPDYLFNTRITRLEVLEERKSFSARVGVEFSITRSSDDALLAEFRWEETRQLEEADLNLFASEASLILREAFLQFLDRIHQESMEIPDEGES